ncbi:hypothetical protein [Flavobacterium sp. CSZ]|uniref:hypothetical protein n=1 Tax=Flavobacterium sp. CSZ TaxID=2783791 RepID=UPI00188CB55E|nr:hypothetical protein [Flavobacterium sp. CSZ]MBF4483242.1 hypothetical protein [Flavobacterium sp. CSZ]
MLAFIQYFDENFSLKTKEVFETIVDGKRHFTLSGIERSFFPTALYVGGSRVTGVTIVGTPNLDVIGFINDFSTNDTSIIPLNAFYNAYDTVVFEHTSAVTFASLPPVDVPLVKEYKALIFFSHNSEGMEVRVFKNTLGAPITWDSYPYNGVEGFLEGTFGGSFGSADWMYSYNADIYVQKARSENLNKDSFNLGDYSAFITDFNKVKIEYPLKPVSPNLTNFKAFVHITSYEPDGIPD